jgi:hypothetical protein
MIFFVIRGAGIEMFKFLLMLPPRSHLVHSRFLMVLNDAPSLFPSIPQYHHTLFPYLYGDKKISSDKEFPFSNGLQFSVQ